MKNKKIILYDEDCRLCSRSVAFLRDRDHKGLFKPMAFQSQEGKEYAASYHVDPFNPHSVVLVEGNTMYDKSAAGIRIARHLKGMRWIARLAGAMPSNALDRIYDLVARHRVKVFGKKRPGNT